jgi:SNF2 family DNA or RNA helicase
MAIGRCVMYKCGHVDIVKQLTAGDYDDFVSVDGKKPYKFQVDSAIFASETANGRFLMAHEMGLGKTVIFCMIVKKHAKEMTKFLVLCKAGLKIQWQRMMANWCGEDWMPQIIESEADFIIPGVKGYIVSFDTLWRFKDIPAWIAKAKVKCIALDEVQHFKNTDAKRTVGVQKACKEVKFIGALSGTPISNHAAEYFPILNILQPHRYRTRSEFERTYVDSFWNGYSFKYGGMKDAERFKRDTSDFILRYTRAEVLPDLPPISRDFRFSELGDKVEAAYKDTLKQMQDYYLYGSASDSALQRSANLLAYMAKMRHLTGIAKIEPTVSFLSDFIEETEPERKIVVFTHHKDVHAKLHELLQTQHKDLSVLSLPDNPDARYAVIEEFRNNPQARILLASVLASAEGLNLQFCADGIMMEREWTPIKEEQAESRFPRPGQTASAINITYMIAIGTIDEYLTKIDEQKRQHVYSALDGKNSVTNWDESRILQELAEVLVASGGKHWGW